MPQNPDQRTRDFVIKHGAKPMPMESGGRSWFFGIGIDKYTHFTPLQNAVKDVKDLISLLQKKYDLTPEHTLTLYNEKATRTNIIRSLDRLQREVGPADKLIIYYSGHGHFNKEIGKGYWIPTDAEDDNTSAYIRNSTIREYIETLETLHTLLISDSCFSGSLFVRGAKRSTAAINELANIPSRWAICSGRHDEEVCDGPSGGNSPFSESIQFILRTNNQPLLNVARLADRVVEMTRANYEQLPEGAPMYGVGHKGGQYMFRLKGVESSAFEPSKITDTPAAARSRSLPPVKSRKKNIGVWIVSGLAVLLLSVWLLSTQFSKTTENQEEPSTQVLKEENPKEGQKTIESQDKDAKEQQSVSSMNQEKGVDPSPVITRPRKTPDKQTDQPRSSAEIKTPAAPKLKTYRFRGQVTDARTGAGIAQAEIFVAGESRGSSGDDGRFTVEVQSEKEDFFDLTFVVKGYNSFEVTKEPPFVDQEKYDIDVGIIKLNQKSSN